MAKNALVAQIHTLWLEGDADECQELIQIIGDFLNVNPYDVSTMLTNLGSLTYD